MGDRDDKPSGHQHQIFRTHSLKEKSPQPKLMSHSGSDFSGNYRATLKSPRGLYSTGNSTQYSVVTYLGTEPKKRVDIWICTGFPDGSVGKEYTCNAGDEGSIPGWGRSPGGGNGNPL